MQYQVLKIVERLSKQPMYESNCRLAPKYLFLVITHCLVPKITPPQTDYSAFVAAQKLHW